ncbi:MAG: methyltransferase type 11 [Nitrospirota bacterium]
MDCKKYQPSHIYLPIGIKRWHAYWTQINYVYKTKAKKILEIGPGRRVVTDYLIKAGLDISSCDIDPKIKADYHCNLEDIPLEMSYELVFCCEVLEHMPYEKFYPSLKKIYSLTTKYALISLPQRHHLFYFKIIIMNRTLFEFKWIKPIFRKKHIWDGQHYWEVNAKGYSENKIRDDIERVGFKILEEKTHIENPYNRFYLLEKI